MSGHGNSQRLKYWPSSYYACSCPGIQSGPRGTPLFPKGQGQRCYPGSNPPPPMNASQELTKSMLESLGSCRDLLSQTTNVSGHGQSFGRDFHGFSSGFGSLAKNAIDFMGSMRVPDFSALSKFPCGGPQGQCQLTFKNEPNCCWKCLRSDFEDEIGPIPKIPGFEDDPDDDLENCSDDDGGQVDPREGCRKYDVVNGFSSSCGGPYTTSRIFSTFGQGQGQSCRCSQGSPRSLKIQNLGRCPCGVPHHHQQQGTFPSIPYPHPFYMNRSHRRC